MYYFIFIKTILKFFNQSIILDILKKQQQEKLYIIITFFFLFISLELINFEREK